MRLLLGLLLGFALAAGAAWLYRGRAHDCLGRCGDGTRCTGGRCVASAAPAPTPAPPPAKKRKHHTSGGGAQAELKLLPGDERTSSAGDALGRPEHIDFNQPGDDGKELPQEEIDRIFQPAQGAISRCMTDAVGDYPLESGKVEVAFRIERSGAVKRVRVQGPQLLMRRGLYPCARGAVTALSFPPSGGASVVTFPFALQ